MKPRIPNKYRYKLTQPKPPKLIVCKWDCNVLGRLFVEGERKE